MPAALTLPHVNLRSATAQQPELTQCPDCALRLSCDQLCLSTLVVALCLAALVQLHVAATPVPVPPPRFEPEDLFPEADPDAFEHMFTANPFDAYSSYETNQWSDPFPPYPHSAPAPPRTRPVVFASPPEQQLHGPRVLILPSSTGSLPYPRPVLMGSNSDDPSSNAAVDPCSIPSAPPVRSRSFMLESLAREVADAMDFSEDPCSNFYKYACGGWLEKNNVSTIPADVSSWSKSSAQWERAQMMWARWSAIAA